MKELLAVGIGGFIGSCFRYSISQFIDSGTGVPYATLTANIIAGFMIGMITILYEQTDLISDLQKLLLTTGLLGGLSTFSTFSLETVRLFSSGQILSGSLNIGLNVFCSLAGVLLGMLAGHLIKSAI